MLLDICNVFVNSAYKATMKLLLKSLFNKKQSLLLKITNEMDALTHLTYIS